MTSPDRRTVRFDTEPLLQRVEGAGDAVQEVADFFVADSVALLQLLYSYAQQIGVLSPTAMTEKLANGDLGDVMRDMLLEVGDRLAMYVQALGNMYGQAAAIKNSDNIECMAQLAEKKLVELEEAVAMALVPKPASLSLPVDAAAGIAVQLASLWVEDGEKPFARFYAAFVAGFLPNLSPYAQRTYKRHQAATSQSAV